jgi:hypothetical protein
LRISLNIEYIYFSFVNQGEGEEKFTPAGNMIAGAGKKKTTSSTNHTNKERMLRASAVSAPMRLFV